MVAVRVLPKATELALPGESASVVATATAEATMSGRMLAVEDLAQVETAWTDESDTKEWPGMAAGSGTFGLDDLLGLILSANGSSIGHGPRRI